MKPLESQSYPAAVEALITAWDSSHLPPLSCGGCTRCCHGDTIWIQPGEDPKPFKTRLVKGRRQLRKGDDGNCVYLGEGGCQIQDHKPLVCRLFDCRVALEHTLRHPPTIERARRLTFPPLQRGRELHPKFAKAKAVQPKGLTLTSKDKS